MYTYTTLPIKYIIKKLIYETKKYLSTSLIKYCSYRWYIMTILGLNSLPIKEGIILELGNCCLVIRGAIQEG